MAQELEKTAEPEFSAVLRPHRSLGRPGFIILMSAIGIVSFVAGMAFLYMGAWPVFGFFGLDAALIYWAFKRNYADAEVFEAVEIRNGELIVRKGGRNRKTREWRFQTFWVRVELEHNEHLETFGPLWLTSHGKRLQLGAFLGSGELHAFSEALSGALRRTKFAN
ncbi:MAG: DUF2244 domain-containing protein [Hyphomicrobiales bacterium]